MPADAVFDALGDPTRRQILRALSAGPRAVGELSDQVPVRRPAVSKHLRVLQGAGLVTYETRGTRHLYALAPEGYVAAQQWFVETWDTVLHAFAVHLEEERS
jgi:DNA-binding transcriptional ArsR family regulator